LSLIQSLQSGGGSEREDIFLHASNHLMADFDSKPCDRSASSCGRSRDSNQEFQREGGSYEHQTKLELVGSDRIGSDRIGLDLSRKYMVISDLMVLLVLMFIIVYVAAAVCLYAVWISTSRL
jgi:hypothetical protein